MDAKEAGECAGVPKPRFDTDLQHAQATAGEKLLGMLNLQVRNEVAGCDAIDLVKQSKKVVNGKAGFRSGSPNRKLPEGNVPHVALSFGKLENQIRSSVPPSGRDGHRREGHRARP